MQDLTLVGLTDDGKKLVMVSDSGEEFAVDNDAKLRAAIRGDQARLGQLEIQMESALRPRDIQARIRAGESPEKVAAAAQTSVDRIMGFATPVLAERAHIAERAQRSSVRRKAGEGASRPLADAVAERLRERNVSPDSVEWDAWRREDGRWTLVADYHAEEKPRHAEFVFDAPGRYVVPEDDEAKWLIGERRDRKDAQARAGGRPRRLSPVTSFDDELPLGSDAINMVSGPVPADTSADEPGDDQDREPTADLSTIRRAARQNDARPEAGHSETRHPRVDPTSISGDADWMATQATERAPHPSPTAPSEEPAAAGSDRDDPSEEERPEEAHEKPRPARKQVRKKGGRASVPSWDEIMFGGGKAD